uniref:Uncharacterized protein n=1 Tax=Cacopsylla melanoneura TaxID=428564 RepID=A0A8D8R4D0_9HEMI
MEVCWIILLCHNGTYNYRVRSLHTKHHRRKAVHNVLRNGWHSTRSGHVPEYRRTIEQVCLHCDTTSQGIPPMSSLRGYRNQPDVRYRTAIVHYNHYWGRCILQV